MHFSQVCTQTFAIHIVNCKKICHRKKKTEWRSLGNSHILYGRLFVDGQISHVFHSYGAVWFSKLPCVEVDTFLSSAALTRLLYKIPLVPRANVIYDFQVRLEVLISPFNQLLFALQEAPVLIFAHLKPSIRHVNSFLIISDPPPKI